MLQRNLQTSRNSLRRLPRHLVLLKKSTSMTCGNTSSLSSERLPLNYEKWADWQLKAMLEQHGQDPTGLKAAKLARWREYATYEVTLDERWTWDELVVIIPPKPVNPRTAPVVSNAPAATVQPVLSLPPAGASTSGGASSQ